MTLPSEVTLDAPSETLLAVRNVLKLGSSLLFTWGIAVVIRLVLPRYLGPSLFGALTFADAFTATFFVALSLGIDVYVHKHISVRASHASDFFGGTLVLRLIIAAFVIMAMALVMNVTHRSASVRLLVYLFAIAELFIVFNATLSALLHAQGRVDGVSVLAVVSKATWAGGVILAIWAGAGLWSFAALLLVSEAVKTAVLFRLAQRHIGLVIRVDVPATKAMIKASMPYYLQGVAITVYGKLDMTLLDSMGNNREVGWYGAASAIAGLTLLVTPLIGWVLMPQFARAAARSHDELYERLRSATRIVLTVAIPVSLFVSLGAGLWVRILFGAPFVPAALAVRILAATFVLMYVSIVYAITLMMLERAWTLAAIGFAGVIANVSLNLLLIRSSMNAFGDGGGGAGCALAVLGTEITVTFAMAWFVGRRAFDRRTLSIVAKTVAACAVVVLTDRLAAPLGWSRLVLDALVYVAIVLGTRAIETDEIVGVMMTALKRKGSA